MVCSSSKPLSSPPTNFLTPSSLSTLTHSHQFAASSHTVIPALPNRRKMTRNVLAAMTALYHRLTTPASAMTTPTSSKPTMSTRLPERVLEPTTLEELPTEIIGLILYFCGDVEVACLGLTSRYIHAVASHFGLPRGLNIEASEALCQLLEPLAPGYSYCRNQGKLIAFSARSLTDRMLAYHDCAPQAGRTEIPPAIFAASDCFKLPWCTARLITNRHFHGPSHGLPVSAISHAHGTGIGYYTHFHQAWDARVTWVGELMLRCTRTWCSRKGALSITMGRDLHLIAVCLHIKTDYRKDHLGCRRYDIGSRKYYSHRICAKCGTECDIRIGPATGNVAVEGRFPNETEPLWTVTVTTYYNLGTCRSADAYKWAVFSKGLNLKHEARYRTLKAQWDISPA
ncbi:uncharacterized protein B0I36DRAFT_353992 [Microdochium trichocladiopsis]|uniref:F-box domain-containing protein n=1 Tax=Microdochium trichocladiopsis TaxID=1682393 RepID=A0A9P8XWP2_9PEZI|nr:uncharacterized protein B0I36DRAFT_353992 [Microdochium trichocladiopsis]KAH7021322.1 hypothetical protein B0I36DRAFT_353992 [Microdochium trichocladiopsis]